LDWLCAALHRGGSLDSIFPYMRSQFALGFKGGSE
jgi:hypothetical protein